MIDSSEAPQSPDQEHQPVASFNAAAPQRVWKSEELLGSEKEVLILHNDKVYRLFRTRHDKLVLIK